MIRQAYALPPLSGYCGAKLETLFDCYREIPSLASFYAGGGFCCAAFGGRLTVCGAPDADELAAFASFLGAQELEGEALPAIDGYDRGEHPLMTYAGAARAAALPETIDLRTVFDILCDADDAFREESDYLPWLSDLRRRAGRGRAQAYLRGGAAVLVTAKTASLAVVDAVACRRDARGRGTAASLVGDVAASFAAEGVSVVTAAENEALAGYYGRIGFVKRGSLLLLTRKTPL